jgi:hypothetical protein
LHLQAHLDALHRIASQHLQAADSTLGQTHVYVLTTSCVAAAAAAAAAGTTVIAAFVSNTARSTDAAFDLDLVYNATAAYAEVPDPPRSIVAPTAQKPGPPSRTSTITVTWLKPACDGSSPVTSYTLTSLDGSLGPTVVRRVTNPLATGRISATFSGLKPCLEYQIWITANNAAGSSPPVRVLTFTNGC